jgi:hypothetical protein
VWEQLKWLPTTIIFFNSVLFHMTEVCATYFLGLPVSWGATAKVCVCVYVAGRWSILRNQVRP